jgi:hypothetical protein
MNHGIAQNGIRQNNPQRNKDKVINNAFKPEKRRTAIATQETFLDDFFKPLVPKSQRTKEVDRILDKYTTIEKREYYIIGYGSLMNKRSREKTFTGEAFPAKVNGWARVFNLASRKNQGRTVLNVFEKENTDMNVVITKTSHKALFSMFMREWQYDIVEVDVDQITDMNGNPIDLPSKPIMVVAREDRVGAETVPILSYVQTCIKGCSEVSEAMTDTFLDSTYLADKETTVRDWLDTFDIVDYFTKYDSQY